MAYAFNHQVPGPRIRLTEGDHVRFNVTNHLPEPTTIHWHGLIVPNAMDGPAEITQDADPAGRQLQLRVHGSAGRHLLLPLAHRRRPPAGARAVRRADRSHPKDAGRTPSRPTRSSSSSSRSGTSARATPTRRCRWKASCRTSSRSTASPTRRPRPSTSRSASSCSSASSARRARSSTRCTSTAGRSRSSRPTESPLPEAARYEKDTVNVGPGERYDVDLAGSRTRQVAAPLPHQPPHDERQRRGAGRWRTDAGPRCDRVGSLTRRSRPQIVVGALAQREQPRARERNRHASDPARSATDAAPITGWIGAKTDSAPETPSRPTTTLLQIGQPIARKAPTDARPTRVGAPSAAGWRSRTGAR